MEGPSILVHILSPSCLRNPPRSQHERGSSAYRYDAPPPHEAITSDNPSSETSPFSVLASRMS